MTALERANATAREVMQVMVDTTVACLDRDLSPEEQQAKAEEMAATVQDLIHRAIVDHGTETSRRIIRLVGGSGA